MDRRTKFILLVIASLLLFAAVGWFIVWPTIAPLFPRDTSSGPVAQPPVLPDIGSPQTPPIGNTGNGGDTGSSGSLGTGPGGAATFTPSDSPDAAIIATLARRAGVLAERVESGASSDGFANLTDAQLDVSSALAAQFRLRQAEMRGRYPSTGALYLTTARRLTAQGEGDVITGAVFRVAVQLQVTTRDMAQSSDQQQQTSYRQATVTFTNNDTAWIASGYASESFTP